MTSCSSATFDAPREQVWKLARILERVPRWSSGARRGRRRRRRDGRSARWQVAVRQPGVLDRDEVSCSTASTSRSIAAAASIDLRVRCRGRRPDGRPQENVHVRGRRREDGSRPSVGHMGSAEAIDGALASGMVGGRSRPGTASRTSSRGAEQQNRVPRQEGRRASARRPSKSLTRVSAPRPARRGCPRGRGHNRADGWSRTAPARQPVQHHGRGAGRRRHRCHRRQT